MHNPLEPPERPSGATESPLRTDSSGRCLHDLVWAQAAACPDAVAVWSRGGELTYGELRRRALAIAGRLQQRGVGPGDRVGLAVARGPELVPAMLGIISAGAAWVGVDLGQPRARLSWLIEDAQLRAVVSDSAGDGALGGGGPERVSASASGATPDYVAPRVGPDHIATLIYTSGSTGQPKGALLTHAGLVNLVEGWAREPGLGAGDRMLGLSSVAFDMSILDVFLPLSVGATVVLVDRETTPDGAALARLAEQRAVTFILATPSTWRLLLAGDFRPPGRLVGVAGGEVLTPDLADRLIALGVELYNGYGVSEASACSCLWRVTSGRAPVPIGRPAPGVRVDLLDPSGNPVGDGEIGELWISGVGVARGYHRRPDLTAACFTEDPSTPGRLRYRTGDRARCEPDGLLTLHGRDDDQVKVRGHRVELGEVEAALLASPHIGEACVVPAESASGDTHLVAFIVCEPNAPLDLEAQTLATLAATLPSAFIPASIHRADSLPRNSSGKVDRRALQAATARRPGSLGPPVPPAAGLEGEIAALVAQILGLPLVGATDRFVALGGASLAATRLVQQLRGTLGLAVPLVRVLEDGSPRALLAASVKVVADSAPTLARDAGLPLSPEQAQLWFIASLAPGATAYHTALEAELDGPLDLAALTRAWALLALRHEVLRSRWVGSPAGPVQYVDSAPRGALAVHDLSDLPVAAAESRAVELARSIHAEPFDLAAGHVIRGAVLRFAPERHRLLACIHHIAFDGASLAVLQRDLAALYAHALGLAAAPPPLEAQVADLAARDGRAAADTQALAAFWRERLRDLPPVQALPGAVAVASARTDTAASWPLRVDAPTAAAVTTLAGEVGATPFAVLLSALAALLRRETGQGDLAVGTLLSAREQSGADGLIGHLARTLVLRLDATGEPDFRTLTQRTRDRVLEAMAHAELPFDQVVTAVGRTRHGEEQPLFQTVFAWQDPPPEAARVGGLAIHASEAFHGAAPFDLLVQCWPDGDGYAGSLVHRTDRLPLDAGEALARRFEAAVASLAADPAGPAFAANGDHLSAERALRGRPGIDDAVIGPRPRPDGTVEQVAWVLGPGAEAAGSPTGPVLVTVARIPLLADGQPDRALLAAHAAPEPARDPALHLDDLLGAPAPPAAAPPAPPTATSPAATARSARPALREGPPLRLPDDAPRDLPAVLRRAASPPPGAPSTSSPTGASDS
ncbi:MAG: amino acid adenylation domain-containing protein [Myxococcota bacterium]